MSERGRGEAEHIPRGSAGCVPKKELDVPPGNGGRKAAWHGGSGGREGLGRLATFTSLELITVVSLARCVWPDHAYAEPG